MNQEKADQPTVDLIACGYEWICPNLLDSGYCNTINTEIEAVTSPVTCGAGVKDVMELGEREAADRGCGATFQPGIPEHAYE